MQSDAKPSSPTASPNEVKVAIIEDQRKLREYLVVLISGTEGFNSTIGSDNGIYRWNGQDWDRVPGSGVMISVQSNGAPWVVNEAGEIYHWVLTTSSCCQDGRET